MECRDCGQPHCAMIPCPAKEKANDPSDGASCSSCSGFLSAEQIQAGSWWRAADGGKYGCVVLSVNLKTKEATVIGTDGKQREIDAFKLQYRYAHCIPNAESIHPDKTSQDHD